jgi:hypothetical protein
MRRLFLIVPLAAVIAALAGCGGSSSATPATASVAASASPSGPPLDGGSYTGTDALLSALHDAGIPCSAPEAIANATAQGAIGMVDCDSPGGTGSDSVVVVFDTQTDAQGYAEGMTAAGPLAAAAVVYGLDWAVNTTTAYAAAVQGKLGGGTLAGPAPSAS